MSPVDADLRERIRATGLRVTAARVAVLRLLAGRAAPSSHPEVAAALAEDGWDRATLYRNLVDLTEVGLLRRIELGDHVWRYDLAGENEASPHDSTHPHFLCTVCGDTSCLPNLQFPIPTAGVPAAVLAGAVSIQFRGTCDRCQATAPGP